MRLALGMINVTSFLSLPVLRGLICLSRFKSASDENRVLKDSWELFWGPYFLVRSGMTMRVLLVRSVGFSGIEEVVYGAIAMMQKADIQ